ncbi:flavin monoamine oxidase family protein [Persicitalea jodogahamensis]|uniref:Monoamine oxidase n=1 Tax=Persicitalea jodogahamensis TaxID=402147 RepID=A0A8J3D1F4_9BACT|nr:NAD(P)/FAD-dependent oxidoreductase [Persicitalea jodogahamensis]GHB63680.1 monoamine oxidase [Persicitalea jodogahamensis]
MKPTHAEVIIVGAGLTGLLLARYLNQANVSLAIVEARERVGGRILTRQPAETTPLEMGATWLGRKHTELVRLLSELGIGTFEQRLGDTAIYEPISTSPPQLVTLPLNADPSFRIAGGTSALIQNLHKSLREGQLFAGQTVKTIRQEDGALKVLTEDRVFEAPVVVSTLPPYLFAQTISVKPALPATLMAAARGTHTWMGDSIKVSLAYARPFWRKVGTSGTVFSNSGPISEMYDHSNIEETRFALMGFFNGSYYSVSREERLELVLKQLQNYYGEEAGDFLAYEEAVWRNEPHTYSAYDSPIVPHQNNGHPAYQQACLDGQLFIAGSETAAAFPGYMEGAVRSAAFVFGEIKKRFQ